jgi:geranylgeranyl diphosphate synthase type II
MHSPDRLIADLKPRQERIDAALREWLGRVAGGAPGAVREAMAYSLFAPGKRLRPVLAALACEAAGGALELALPAGCAVEMVHTYSLIHDDLPAMDDDDLRRGQPTCHKKYGEALAILAGDALLTAAFEVLAAGYGPRTAAVSCLELARGAGAAGMVGGQVLDLEAEGRLGEEPNPPTPFPKREGGVNPAPPSKEGGAGGTLGSPSPTGKGVGGLGFLEDIHARKTGALFRAALRMGVFAAQAERPHGADPGALAAADAYAAAFGLLFQVTDDLLDVESTADKTGKRVGKDAARGKLTYPGLLGGEASRGKAAELGQAAVAAAEQLGSGLLASLAQYVVDRDR